MVMYICTVSLGLWGNSHGGISWKVPSNTQMSNTLLTVLTQVFVSGGSCRMDVCTRLPSVVFLVMVDGILVCMSTYLLAYLIRY